MDKKRLSFREQFLLGYTIGSIGVLISTFLFGDKIDLQEVQLLHIMLLCVTLSNGYIWTKYYWIGMPKKELWKIRGITGVVGLTVFWCVFIIHALIRDGFEITLNSFPQTMLLATGIIVFGRWIWFIITDYLEKLALKQINAKLSENRPQ